MGESPGGAPENTVWLDVHYADGVEPPRSTRAGWVILAEGRFDGTTITEDDSAECDGCRDWIYQLQGFTVLRWRVFGESETPELRVVEAAEAARPVTPLSDGRPWLVAVASIPKEDRGGAQRATALRDRLVAAGFASAEVLDGRAARLLFCCYDVVVAGRFATRREAESLARNVRRRRFSPTVRRGW